MRLFIFLAAFAASLLLSGLFAPSLPIRFILALPAAIMLAAGLNSLSGNRRRSDRREQYRALLSHLLSQASIGRFLEQSLATAHSAMAADYPPRHAFSRILQQTERQILGNQPVAVVVDQLVRSLDCPEATVGLGILRRISLSGSTLVTYLRRADQSLADLIEITHDIAAQHARTAAEASILGIMPFILAFLLRQSGGYFDPALNHPVGVLILGAAFLVAVLALAIIPATTSPQEQRPSAARQSSFGSESNPGSPNPSKSVIARPGVGRRNQLAAARLRQLLTRLLGDGRNHRIDEALMRIYGESVEARARFDLQKLNFLLAGLVLGLLLAIASAAPLLFPVPAIVLIFMQDQQTLRQAKQEELRLLSAFPFFLHVCVSLLEAGLTVHHVLEITAAAFAGTESARVQPPLARDTRKMSQGLRSGWPVDRILTQLASQSATAELRSAYQLLVRYSQLGGKELLQQLMQQTQACWTVYRNASRSRMDEQSMRMMLPMMLDLIVILVISLTPALILLGTSL